ncbi:putative late blight resistance protein homolog R1B-16 isoform X2 [Ipomoea triloba]|uniref:putative late blight resistance protein homolog R1B-16 isoform X2 n=1 Tax=Ipomoea triloba TaxID=35885 RepID=UPI00125D001B|nr:putative late blight resistance protein homolog R1B-16 isoform X2 [Ipomoea triloba]
MAISLVTLLNTIDFHFLQPLPCLSVDDREIIMIRSLCKKLRFLQAFLEDSQKKNINCPAWRGLETEIRDVAAEAESKIELELYQLYNEEDAPVEPYQSLHQTLQQVTRDIESLEGRIIQIQIESNRNHSVEPPRRNAAIENIKADCSSKRSSEPNNVMVGCDDEFETIKHKLISDSKNLEVISITGMGGIGKTTLAQRVYKDEAAIASYFDIRAWTTVSQEHNLREILCDLLGSNDTNLDVSHLESKLRQKLLGQRYLIVIDDIWSIQAWDAIHRCFPEEDFRSRILLTTQLKQVANYVSSGNNLYSMRLLNLDESWDLFYKRVFVEKRFPLEFEKVGRCIVEKCQGLPLTIIVVAGLLSSSNKPSLNQWENVVANLDPLLNTDPEMKCSKILSLSYNHLPLHLKTCFLYFGIFSEDEAIKVKELIKLWIAEGFLKIELNKSMEDVAYDYLQDLVDRSLVQIDKWSCFDNKIKYCKLHDVLHSFSLREAQRAKLLFVIKGNNNVHELGLATSSSDRKACCRVVSDQLSNEPINPSRYTSHTSHELRSFQYHQGIGIYYRKFIILPNSKLLRVLDIRQYRLNDLPREIEDLVHLRYLALRIRLKTQYTIAFIDHQWCKLRCLQTIIIDGCWPCFSPNNILGMPQIRHVHFSKRTLHHFHLLKLVQENLQTLSWLSLPHRLRTEPDFKGIPNVKELGIQLMDYKDCYDMHSLSKETWDLLPPISMEGLLKLNQLENLKFKTNQWSPICDIKLQKVFPPNLKKLTFKRTYFSWEDMTIIHTLPNLEVLKLRYNAFCGPEWKATGNGFCKLKYLEVTGHSTLEHWSVDADHFPILECIFLNDCDHLVEFPTGFGEINTLQLIHLKHCSSSLVTSAKNIQEDRRDFGDDKLVLRVFYTLPEPKCYRSKLRGEDHRVTKQVLYI